MLVTLGILVVILIAICCVIAAGKPDTFEVERRIHIAATPDKVFPLVSDFHNWKEWSPYEDIDPLMKRTYSGSDSGVGAVYEWSGNSKVGTGRMEMSEATKFSFVKINLHFLKPFEGRSVASFHFLEKDDGTEVSWGIRGEAGFVCKLVSIICTMDRMIGDQYEKGLGKLKALVEKRVFNVIDSARWFL